MVTRSVGGIDKRFFFKSAFLNPNPDPCIMNPDPHFLKEGLNPNPDPCIMDSDPHFLKEGVTIVSHSLPPPLEEFCHNFLNIDLGCSKISFNKQILL